jgi:putative DNA primase/helicase
VRSRRPDITASRIVWGEPLEGSARDLLAEAEDDGKGPAGDGGAAAAQAFLRSVLATGERKQSDIAAEGATLGFSKDRLFQASKAISVVKRKEGQAGPWLWRLPEGSHDNRERTEPGF